MENLTTPQPNIPNKPTDTTAQDFKINSIDQQLKYPLDYVSQEILKQFVNTAYPIGSIYMNYTNPSNPSSYLGVGSWTAVEGQVVAGYKSGDPDFGTIGASIGSATHTLDINEIPAHDHVGNRNEAGSGTTVWASAAASPFDKLTTTGSTGGGGAHNNIQPTLVAYVWKRTA
jgi:hypothetical protein